MKHKLLCLILLVQFLLVGIFIVYESISLKNAPLLVINTSVDYLYTSSRTVGLQIANSDTIPILEKDQSFFDEADYVNAYVVFDSQKNQQGFNEVLYICKDKPYNKSYVAVKVYDDYNRLDDKPKLHINYSFEYKPYSKDFDKIKSIRDEKDDDNYSTEDDVLVKAFVKIRNNRFFDSVFCESIEIDGITY